MTKRDLYEGQQIRLDLRDSDFIPFQGGTLVRITKIPETGACEGILLEGADQYFFQNKKKFSKTWFSPCLVLEAYN